MRKMRISMPFAWVLVFVLAVGSIAAAQTPVDLRLWFQESYPGTGGNWTVSPDGLSVVQSINGEPTLFCSDFDIQNLAVEGTIRVDAAADDDYVGFAIDFAPGDTTNALADYWLVDWKAANQMVDFPAPSCPAGGLAARGLAVSSVIGIPALDEFWAHANYDVPCSGTMHGLDERQRGTILTDTGWTAGTAYRFSFEVQPTSMQVYVDGNLEIDVAGVFRGGRLCFYNFSQAQVTYEAFTIDCSPTALASSPGAICDGDSVTLDASASLPCDANGLEYRWLESGTPVCDWSPSAMCDVMPPATTTYDLEVQCVGNPTCGSTDSANVTVQVIPAPVAAAGADVAVCELVPVTLDASGSLDLGCRGGLVYEWREGVQVRRAAGPDPTWSPPTGAAGTTTYSAIVRCGSLPTCEAADDVTVEVRACPLDVTFDTYSATLTAAGVILEWTTSLEAGTLGFVVERAPAATAPFTVVAAAPALGRGHVYTATDAAGSASDGAWYRIVELTPAGRGTMTAAFRALESTSGRSRGRRARSSR